MPIKEYGTYLDENDYLFVQFSTKKGNVDQFVVKYYSRFADQWMEVLRFDSSHDCPHKDILRPDGSTERKVWYPYFSNAQALTFAIADVKEHYSFYRERFRKWLDKEN